MTSISNIPRAAAQNFTPEQGIAALDTALLSLVNVAERLPQFHAGLQSGSMFNPIDEVARHAAAGLQSGAVAVLHNVDGGDATNILESAARMSELAGSLGTLSSPGARNDQVQAVADDLVRNWTQPVDGATPFTRIRTDAEAAIAALRALPGA